MNIRDFPVKLVTFSENDIKWISEKVQSITMNPSGANGLLRSAEVQHKNKLMGFLAEKAVYDILREEFGSVVYQREKQDIKNQVDIFCGTKTVEVRSSQVKDGIEAALFNIRNNGDSRYHLVGSYTNGYKIKEIIKDFYVWVVFEKSFDHCYIVGGATKDMISTAPLITMVPKGTSCKSPGYYRALKPSDILNFEDLISAMTPQQNETLSLAKKNKEDEFYTLLTTVETEVQHYKNLFKNRIVYCPCDNPDISNFWKFFYDNFNKYQLAELRATYLGNPAIFWSYNGSDITKTVLEEDGSFSSDECKEILKSSDIVITNPPFSLFRSFVKLLISYKKDFLIIGNQNAATTKDIFPLFQQDIIRYGYQMGSQRFQIPDWYETRSDNVKTDDSGNRFLTVEGIRWFTTLPVNRKSKLVCTQRFSPFKYKRYDNYPAHEVSFVKDIPVSYAGLLGVPISYLNVHDKEQFELIGTSGELAGPVTIDDKVKNNPGRFYLDGKRLYERIVIRRVISNAVND